MKVIMTGGGTGGHIYPAIAIADEIKKRFPDAEILFVGAKRGLEKTLVPDNGYPIKLIPVQGFNRKNPLKNVEVLRDLKQGNKLSKQILKEFQPGCCNRNRRIRKCPCSKNGTENAYSYLHP